MSMSGGAERGPSCGHAPPYIRRLIGQAPPSRPEQDLRARAAGVGLGAWPGSARGAKAASRACEGQVGLQGGRGLPNHNPLRLTHSAGISTKYAMARSPGGGSKG